MDQLSRQAYICDAAVDEVSGLSDTIAGLLDIKGKEKLEVKPLKDDGWCTSD